MYYLYTAHAISPLASALEAKISFVSQDRKNRHRFLPPRDCGTAKRGGSEQSERGQRPLNKSYRQIGGTFYFFHNHIGAGVGDAVDIGQYIP